MYIKNNILIYNDIKKDIKHKLSKCWGGTRKVLCGRGGGGDYEVVDIVLKTCKVDDAEMLRDYGLDVDVGLSD